MQKETDQWNTSWFDTPFYHILYKDRDTEEAGFLMKKLTSFLQLEKKSEILDLACGKGRHAGQQLEGQHTKCPIVCRAVVPHVIDDLGRNILGRAAHGEGLVLDR